MPDILSGITALVKTINIEVIAEGVETASQVEILKKAGVKNGAGMVLLMAFISGCFYGVFLWLVVSFEGVIDAGLGDNGSC